MHRFSWIAVVLFFCSAVFSAQAQPDRLQGRWQGTVQGPQGEQATTATFKKEADGYTGTISGMRGDMPLKDIKLDGDKVTARAEVQTQQSMITITFEFMLQGDSLKGKGEANFGGQAFEFAYEMKRAAEGALPTAPAAPQGQGQGQQRPAGVAQPVQKQSLDYFAGQWKFKWIGRESLLGPGGPREGILTNSPVLDGKFMEGRVQAKGDSGNYEEVSYLGFDPEKKQVTWFEHRNNDIPVVGIGDWSSPIGIRFKIHPIKLKNQTLQLRRTIAVVAAHSFTVTEELSVDGGPFQRLGNAVFSRVEASAAK